MKQYFSKQNRALLSELVRTDFKLRYQGSVLGYAWSLLRPLFMFTILYMIFGVILKSGGDIPHFPIYLLLGIVLWQFFADMTNQSLGSIVGRGDLIRKIKIPRWMIVASTSVAAIISLLLNLIVISVFMLFNNIDIMKSIILFPLYIAEIYVLALGMSLFLSSAFVKYRDISYIWEVILQAGFYVTPILYSMTFITNVTVQKILLLNPMAQAIQGARYAVVSHHPNVITAWRVFDSDWYTLIPIFIVLIVLVTGILYFKKESKYFAENL